MHVILLFNVHNNVGKFDSVTNCMTKGQREKENHLESQSKYL